MPSAMSPVKAQGPEAVVWRSREGQAVRVPQGQLGLGHSSVWNLSPSLHLPLPSQSARQ